MFLVLVVLVVYTLDMSKETTVILLGALVVIVPYLGVPSSWRTLALIVIGIALMIVGFMLRGKSQATPGSYPFAERDTHATDTHSHDQERVTSLN